MIDLLRKLDGLSIAPVSTGADKQNELLCNRLPFKIFSYESGKEHNGWIVPNKWEVINATIKKDGILIYDGTIHPLGVIGYSTSFKGKVGLQELKSHIFFDKARPNSIVYHCDLYYKPHLKNWGFSMPYSSYLKLQDGQYDIDLQTSHEKGFMKVLVYEHKGESDETIVLNAHNCHSAQLNDGASGYTIAIKFMEWLKNKKTRYTYKLVIAPEHIGTVFYTNEIDTTDIKCCIFLEMLGSGSKDVILQESFYGNSEIDNIAHHILKMRYTDYRYGKFRKIIGNDETVWEAVGVEIPTICLSRSMTRFYPYPEYHTHEDNITIMDEAKLNESLEIIKDIFFILENNAFIQRKFKGLIALSNPKYNLYMPFKDPSLNNSFNENWNYLMDCLPRYFNGQISILDIAIKHNIPFKELFEYILKFKDKKLVEMV